MRTKHLQWDAARIVAAGGGRAVVMFNRPQRPAEFGSGSTTGFHE